MNETSNERDGLGHLPIHRTQANVRQRRLPRLVTLADFLLARIAEDEDYARTMIEVGQGLAAEATSAELSGINSAGVRVLGDSRVQSIMERLLDTDTQPPNDLHRVLAECEAKQRIVAQVVTAADEAERHEGDAMLHAIFGARASFGDAILRSLALPYAAHPDYDEAWRP